MKKLAGFFYRKIMLHVFYFPVLVLVGVVILFLMLIRPFFPIVFYRYYCGRIGNQMLDLEIYLRERQIGTTEKSKEIAVFITDGKIANTFLLELAQRKVKVIKSKFIFDLYPRIIPLFGENQPFLNLPTMHAPNPFYYQGSRQLVFNEEDEIRGKKVLESLGLNEDSRFICFHSRGSRYLQSNFPGIDFSYHDYRNFSVNGYKEAIEELNKKGIWAIRIGIDPEESVSHFGPKTIDYSNLNRTDFGEMYLLSKCLFFLGTSSGVCCVPACFDVPSVLTNSAPLGQGAVNIGDIYIPKKYHSENINRLLKFPEIIAMGADAWFGSEDYRKNKISLIENSPKEVLDVVLELYSRLEKTWVATDREKELQLKYESLWPKDHVVLKFGAKIGTQFLIDHQDLLG